MVVLVAVVVMMVFLKLCFTGMNVAGVFKFQQHIELVRLGKVLGCLQIFAAVNERKQLSRAVGADRFQRDGLVPGQRQWLQNGVIKVKPKPGRHAGLKHPDFQLPMPGINHHSAMRPVSVCAVTVQCGSALVLSRANKRPRRHANDNEARHHLKIRLQFLHVEMPGIIQPDRSEDPNDGRVRNRSCQP